MASGWRTRNRSALFWVLAFHWVWTGASENPAFSQPQMHHPDTRRVSRVIDLTSDSRPATTVRFALTVIAFLRDPLTLVSRPYR